MPHVRNDFRFVDTERLSTWGNKTHVNFSTHNAQCYIEPGIVPFNAVSLFAARRVSCVSVLKCYENIFFVITLKLGSDVCLQRIF